MCLGKWSNAWEGGLVDQDVTFIIGSIPVQTPLGARPGLGTQPRYEAQGDLRVK